MTPKSPKQLFQEIEPPDLNRWNDMTASGLWSSAMAFGYAEYSNSITGGDPNAAAKLSGVREFIVILSQLGEPKPTKKQRTVVLRDQNKDPRKKR